jgi:hypothetical protein
MYTALGTIGGHMQFPVLATAAAAIVHHEDFDEVVALADAKCSAHADFLVQLFRTHGGDHVRSDRGKTVSRSEEHGGLAFWSDAHDDAHDVFLAVENS